MSTKPTDEEILEILKGRHALATYVVTNWLRSKYKGIETPAVLRQLKRMEAAAKVKRVPTSYARQLSWAVA